jgi:predicted KAP-like P-loop ATPase
MSWIRDIFSWKEADPARGSATDESASPFKQQSASISADNPITKPEDDALGRIKSARSFAEQLLTLDSSEGVVVGVLGPWGSGKTSFVNLARQHLKQSGIAILEFNPWMFSGADQLVQSFFIELSAQLKLRADLSEIGDLVGDYGAAFSDLGWVPVVGPWIERGRAASKIVATWLQRRKEGIGARQLNVRAALAKLEKPIVVVLDDIDRLSTSEIRDVFKLVRLTANFPNIIYLLAFDRNRVEHALGEQGIPGRDYLEKILQVGIDLPAIPEDVLNSQIAKAIDSALAKMENPGVFDSDLWPDVFMEIIRPLIRNMRDVRRYATAIHGTVRDLGGQIALVDVLGLEAVRIFLPDVFRNIHAAVEGLTDTSGGSGHRDESPHLKEQLDLLVKAAGDHKKLIRKLVERLFPAGERHMGGSHFGTDWKKSWLRERRVAHEAVLRLYLERIVGQQLQAFSYAENAWANLTDQVALKNYLDSLPLDRLQDVIASLEAYEDKFAPEHVAPATVVLLNLLPNLPERLRGMFEVDTRIVVTRVIYRLLRAIKEPQSMEVIVREILPQVASLSSKQELILMVGYKKGSGHEFVSETTAQNLEKELRASVRAASDEALAQEKELLWTYLRTKRESEADEPALVVPISPCITYALLKSARSETRSQSMGRRAVRHIPRLAWDVLIEIYGDETTLHHRIEELKASPLEVTGDLMDLANKYLAGYRDKNFDDE